MWKISFFVLLFCFFKAYVQGVDMYNKDLLASTFREPSSISNISECVSNWTLFYFTSENTFLKTSLREFVAP